MYTPILRNRRSEVLALKGLSAGVKSRCRPLLDVAAPGKAADVAKAQSYVARNIASAAKAAEGFAGVFVDSSELDPSFRLPGRIHPLTAFADELVGLGCKPIPVTGIHRDEAHLRASLRARSSAEDQSICVRLDLTDVGTPTQTLALLTALMQQARTDPGQTILMLDLQSVYAMSADSLAAQVVRFLRKVSSAGWNSYILAGYGVPDQLKSAVGVRAQGYLARVEQDTFRAVSDAVGLRNLWFGDYTTVAPTHIELDWRLVSKVMSPKAIYALSDAWFVVRGSPFSSHADGYGQYHALAREIVALEDFSGPNFSSGDTYIHECATRKGAGPGSPGSWITACVNHHISLTASEHA